MLVVTLAAGVPDQVFFALRQLAIRLECIYIVVGRQLNQVVFEPSHLFSPPASDRTVVDALAFVRDYQIFADSYYLAQASAYGAGTQRAVETE